MKRKLVPFSVTLFVIFLNSIFCNQVLAFTSLYTISDVTPVHWISRDIGTIQYPPVIAADGSIYQPTNNGLTKLNRSGQVQWVLSDISPPSATPMIKDNVIYFATSGCNPFVYAYDSDGQQKWRYDLREGQGICSDNQSRTSVILNEDQTALLVTISNPALAILSFNLNGTIKWKKSLNGEDPNRSTIAVDTNGDLYSGTSGLGQLFALDKNGLTRWIRATPGNLSSPLLGDDGNIYITTTGVSGGDSVISYDKFGNLRWQLKLSGSQIIKPLTTQETTLYVIEGITLHALNTNNGEQLWQWNSPNTGTLSAATIDATGVIYISSKDTIYTISPNGIVKQSFVLQETLTTPVIASSGNLLISYNKPLSAQAYLYSMGTYTPLPIRTPVIFIPGIGGSELQTSSNIMWSENNGHGGNFNHTYAANEKIWINQSQAASIGFDDYFDILRLQPDTISSTAPLVLNGQLTPFGYGDIGTFFQDLGYVKGSNFFIFTYDWRKDIRDSTIALDNLVELAKQQTGATQVHIVAHSLGGLIARYYIADTLRSNKVDKLIELGVPHLGSVQVLKMLLFGDSLMQWIFTIFPFGITASETKDVLHNYPSAYQLLPSSGYYNFYPHQLTGVSLQGLNSIALHKGEELHDFLDHQFTNFGNVHIFQVVGSGQPTVGQFENGFWGIDELYSNGDGTVPLYSASLKNSSLDLSAGATTYYVDQVHSDLVSKQGTAMQIVKSILQSSILPVLAMDQKSDLEGQDIAISDDAELEITDENGNTALPSIWRSSIGKIKHAFIKATAPKVKVKITSSEKKSIAITVRNYQHDVITTTHTYTTIPISPTTPLEFLVSPLTPITIPFPPSPSPTPIPSATIALDITPSSSPSANLTNPFPFPENQKNQTLFSVPNLAEISLFQPSLSTARKIALLEEQPKQVLGINISRAITFPQIFIGVLAIIGLLLLMLLGTFISNA